jgi:hypothetical protein
MLMALAALVAPLVLRLVWFFPGITLPRRIPTPDYASLRLPAAPISTIQARPVRKVGGNVLVDFAHSNLFQPEEIQALTDALTLRGARIELNSDASLLASDLKSVRAFIVISPASGFSETELQLVRGFVERGGRLVVFADATRGTMAYDASGNPAGAATDTNFVNPLLAPYGITVNADYLYNLTANDGNFRNVFLDALAPSGLIAGVRRVAFYGTHSVQADSGSALLVGSRETLSSQTDATPANDPGKVWAAAALSHAGNVVAFGDFTFMTPPYDTVVDNAVLIDNVADYLLQGKKSVDLADYPYVFDANTVNVLPTSNVQMTAELTGSLSHLESALGFSGFSMSIVQDAPADGNLIVLGTFAPSDDLAPYVRPFGIALDQSSEYVELSGFGKLGRSGNGLLLLRPADKRNTLTVLADTPDDLTSLLDTLSRGELSGCVLEGNVAACSVGSGGSFSQGSPTPETTPTAQVGG